jgi:dTDP-4-amino-4,6-dideoxygalactose transaminase
MSGWSVVDAEAPLHNIVFCKEPDRLVSGLRSQGILAARQYRALYQHPPYLHLHDMPYPNSEFWTQHAVYLPFGTNMTAEEARYVAKAVHDSEIELFETR